MTRGYAWQDVLGHRLELSGAPTGEGTALWGSALWGTGHWGEGWPPVFSDITRRCLSLHSSTGAQGLDLAPGVGTLEVELVDLDGALAPGGDVDWLLGRYLRVWTIPQGQVEHPAWYGVIDKASAGGSFAVPVVSVSAYDVRSIIGANTTPSPIADQAEPAATRLRNVLDVAGFDPRAYQVQVDPSPLLPDDTLELGDLFGRTVDSAGGIAWADGTGSIITQNRGWVNGTGDDVALYVYAGQPPIAPTAPVAQTTDLSASEAISTVRNHVTFANTDDPAVEVVRMDSTSARRYGVRRSRTTDLACDQASLEALADRAVRLHAAPVMVCEGATVTVYDATTALAAGLSLGDVIVIGRNDPDQAAWELTGLVVGIDLDMSPDRCDVALTVIETGDLIAAGAGYWDGAHWGQNRWSPRPTLGTFHLGPSTSDQLDAGYVLA